MEFDVAGDIGDEDRDHVVAPGGPSGTFVIEKLPEPSAAVPIVLLEASLATTTASSVAAP